MVSLTVLVIAVLGAFTTFYGASTLLRDTAETYAAARDAETVLEDLVATPIGAVARVYPSDQPVPEFNGKSLSAEVVRISYPEGTGVRPLLVTVDVSWRDHRGRPRRLLYHRVRAR